MEVVSLVWGKEMLFNLIAGVSLLLLLLVGEVIELIVGLLNHTLLEVEHRTLVDSGLLAEIVAGYSGSDLRLVEVHLVEGLLGEVG